MKKLQIPLSIFIATECNTLVSRIVMALKTLFSIDPYLEQTVTEMEQANIQLTESIQSRQKSTYTSALATADDYRDAIFKGIRNIILGCTFCEFDETEQEAAIQLKIIFKTHGWTLYKEGYQKESSLLNSLLLDLAKSENQTALTTLGIMKWYDELLKAQQNFEKIENEKVQDDQYRETQPIAETLPPLLASIEQFVTYLNGMMMPKKDDADWNKLFDIVELIANEMTAEARSRRTREKTKKAENGGTEAPTTPSESIPPTDEGMDEEDLLDEV